MGNYSRLYGEISIENKNYVEFKKKYTKFLKERDWITFKDLFIENPKYKDVGTMYLNFNPMKNEFKLLGYPDNFEEFFGFLRDNVNMIEHFDIFADVDDSSFFMFSYSKYLDDKFILKLFRTDNGIFENETYQRWHWDFIKSLKQ